MREEFREYFEGQMTIMKEKLQNKDKEIRTLKSKMDENQKQLQQAIQFLKMHRD